MYPDLPLRFFSGFDCHESIVKHKLVSDSTQRISIVLLMASHKISNNSIFWDKNLECDVYLLNLIDYIRIYLSICY